MRTIVLGALPLGLLFLVGCGGGDETGRGGGSAAGTGTGGVTSSDSSAASTSSVTSGAGGSGGSGGSGGAAPTCPSPVTPVDAHAADRLACTFAKGAKVEATLGIDAAARAKIPITHIIIVAEENRSFDHYFGKLSTLGQPDAEGWPAGFTNPDKNAVKVAPHHLTSTCLAADPPHQGTAMHNGWDKGKMDGFVKSAAVSGTDGHFAMGYYNDTDLPFYYWLANTYSIADHYFGATLGGTWANRDYLYAGTSNGVTDTGQATISVPTIYDAMDEAGVTWGVYTDGGVRQDSLGWTKTHKGVAKFSAFLAALGDGSLPAVSFVDPGAGQDEHPPADVQGGEAWGRKIYMAARNSPLWTKLVVVYTYDESGGLADHVPPPKACLASPDQTAFDRYGVRIPAIIISPWARPHYVSHRVHDHTSALRLIELLNDLPALTGRDANADALLDMFDFECPTLTDAPMPPAAGTKGCP
jgi:phospholipase C